jgi:hypothetical protein
MTEKMALAGVDEGPRGSLNNLSRFKLLKNRASFGQIASHPIKRQRRKKCLTQKQKNKATHNKNPSPCKTAFMQTGPRLACWAVRDIPGCSFDLQET